MSETIVRGLDFGCDPVHTPVDNRAYGKAVARFEQLHQRYRSGTAQAEPLCTPA